MLNVSELKNTKVLSVSNLYTVLYGTWIEESRRFNAWEERNTNKEYMKNAKQCDMCNIAFRTSHALKAHKQTMHEISKCEICGQTLYVQDILARKAYICIS